MSKSTQDHLYQADPHMIYVTMKAVLRLKRDCYLCDLVLLIYTSVMYSRFNEDLRLFSVVTAAMIIFLGFVQYLLIVDKGNFINHLAVDVNVSADTVQLQTAAFYGPWWFKKKSVMITMFKTDIRLQQINNPYPGIYKETPKITRLVHKGKDQFFFYSSYFDHRMEEDMMS